MTSEKRFSGREWLNVNVADGNGYVAGGVTYQIDGEHGDPSIDATLYLADCRRVVELGFDTYTPDCLPNTRAKANALRDFIVRFTDAVLAACDEAEPGLIAEAARREVERAERIASRQAV